MLCFAANLLITKVSSLLDYRIWPCRRCWSTLSALKFPGSSRKSELKTLYALTSPSFRRPRFVKMRKNPVTMICVDSTQTTPNVSQNLFGQPYTLSFVTNVKPKKKSVEIIHCCPIWLFDFIRTSDERRLGLSLVRLFNHAVHESIAKRVALKMQQPVSYQN
jgi:hypothetical protein